MDFIKATGSCDVKLELKDAQSAGSSVRRGRRLQVPLYRDAHAHLNQSLIERTVAAHFSRFSRSAQILAAGIPRTLSSFRRHFALDQSHPTFTFLPLLF